MPNFKSMFKVFSPFGKMMKNKIAKGFGMNSLKSTIQTNMSKGSKIGLTKSGIGTKGQLKERLLGVNVGIVDHNYRPLTAGAGHTSARLGSTIGKKIMDMTTRNYAGQIIVGAAAMTSVAVMNGAMNQAQDIVYSRYMNDARYSGRMMGRTRLGSASGNSALNIGNHVGLSLALSKQRHGY
jgi:hypothetical protein